MLLISFWLRNSLISHQQIPTCAPMSKGVFVSALLLTGAHTKFVCPGSRVDAVPRCHSLLQNAHTNSGAHAALYWTSTGVLSQGEAGRGVKLMTHVHLMPSLRIRGAIPLLIWYLYSASMETFIFYRAFYALEFYEGHYWLLVYKI